LYLHNNVQKYKKKEKENADFQGNLHKWSITNNQVLTIYLVNHLENNKFHNLHKHFSFLLGSLLYQSSQTEFFSFFVFYLLIFPQVLAVFAQILLVAGGNLRQQLFCVITQNSITYFNSSIS